MTTTTETPQHTEADEMPTIGYASTDTRGYAARVEKLERQAIQLADRVASPHVSDNDLKAYSETRAQLEQARSEFAEARQQADWATEGQKLRATADERKLNAQLIQDAQTLGSNLRRALRGGPPVRLAVPEFIDAKNYHAELRTEAHDGGTRIRTLIHAPPEFHDLRMFSMMTDVNQIDTTHTTRGYATSTIGTGITNAPIPTMYWPSLVHLMQAAGPMLRRDCFTQIDTPTLEPIEIPVQSGFAGADQKAEDADVQSDPNIAFKKATLNAYKVAGGAKVTEEMLRSTYLPSFLPLIGRDIALAIGRKVNKSLTSDDGSSKPNGILNALTGSGANANNKVTPLTKPSSGQGFAALPEELLGVVGDLDESYEANAKFMMNKRSIYNFMNYTSDKHFQMMLATTIAKVTGTHMPGADEMTDAKGLRTYMLGMEPAVSNPHMGTEYGAGKHVAIYGDGSYFWIRRSDIEIGQSEHADFMKFNTAIRCAMWVDSELTQTGQTTGAKGPLIVISVKS